MKRILFAICVLSLSVCCFGQTDKSAYYKPGVFEYQGISLPFRQLELNQDKDGQSMLVIQLHGGTARGTDNKAQLDASAVDSVETYLRVHRSKVFFLLPQCAADRVWNENNSNYDVVMTEVLKAWIDDFVANHDIDPGKIYITGYSAGGSGSWRMVNDNPGLFAAAGIAAANPVMVTAENVKETPIYAIAGSDDKIMDAKRIENFVKSVVALGGEAKFELLDGKDHFGTCDTAFSKERLDWIFRHQASSGVTIIVDNAEDNAVEVARYSIDGRKVNADYQGIQIIQLSNGKSIKVVK